MPSQTSDPRSAHASGGHVRWLVYAARCGDAHALATLVRMHERLLATIVSDYFAPGRDREDLEQEGRTGLLEAIRNYDGARGVPFRRFAALCIRRKVIQHYVMPAGANTTSSAAPTRFTGW